MPSLGQDGIICTINMENREGMIPRKEGFAIHEIAVSHLPGGRAPLYLGVTREDSRAGVRVSKLGYEVTYTLWRGEDILFLR